MTNPWNDLATPNISISNDSYMGGIATPDQKLISLSDFGGQACAGSPLKPILIVYHPAVDSVTAMAPTLVSRPTMFAPTDQAINALSNQIDEYMRMSPHATPNMARALVTPDSFGEHGLMRADTSPTACVPNFATSRLWSQWSFTLLVPNAPANSGGLSMTAPVGYMVFTGVCTDEPISFGFGSSKTINWNCGLIIGSAMDVSPNRFASPRAKQPPRAAGMFCTHPELFAASGAQARSSGAGEMYNTSIYEANARGLLKSMSFRMSGPGSDGDVQPYAALSSTNTLNTSAADPVSIRMDQADPTVNASTIMAMMVGAATGATGMDYNDDMYHTPDTGQMAQDEAAAVVMRAMATNKTMSEGMQAFLTPGVPLTLESLRRRYGMTEYDVQDVNPQLTHMGGMHAADDIPTMMTTVVGAMMPSIMAPLGIASCRFHYSSVEHICDFYSVELFTHVATSEEIAQLRKQLADALLAKVTPIAFNMDAGQYILGCDFSAAFSTTVQFNALDHAIRPDDRGLIMPSFMGAIGSGNLLANTRQCVDLSVSGQSALNTLLAAFKPANNLFSEAMAGYGVQTTPMTEPLWGESVPVKRPQDEQRTNGWGTPPTDPIAWY